MKKILLTGGSGFFGSRFQKFYRDRYTIIATDKNELDITSSESAHAVIGEHKPDYIIHMAAIAVTDYCNKNPEIAHKINVDGAVNIAKAAKAHGSKLIFLSTEQVFNGNTEPGPYTEEDTPVPNTVYGMNKLEAEGLLREIIPELWILRFTWLYGLPEADCVMNPCILWNTVQTALKGEKVQVTDQEFRGHTFVYDMIAAIEKIFDLPYGLYHMGSANDLDRYTLSCIILREMGLEDKIDALLERVSGAYRDARLCTQKVQSLGVSFEPTGARIAQVIRSSGFQV